MRLATRYDPFERYGIDMKDALREKVRLARDDDERVLVLRVAERRRHGAVPPPPPPLLPPPPPPRSARCARA